MLMTSVLIAGFAGAMGQKAVDLVNGMADFQIVAAFSPQADRNDPERYNLNDDVQIFNDLAAIPDQAADVWIDFTVPSAVYENVKFALNHGMRPVVGTTGLTDEQEAELKALAKANHLGGLIAPNFGMSAVLLMKFAQEAAKYFPDVEVIEMHPEQKLLRTMDGKARAFLSNRYRRIDNLDIARVVLPIIGEMEGARFESCEITDDRMYLKVVNPRLQAEVVPGDVVQAGIMISNSETGLGAVNIQPLIYRLVCSNGMVVNEAGTRRAHIGRVNTTDVNFALYSQQTLDAEDRAFVLKIQDTVRAAVDEARFSTVLERMRESKQAQLNTQDLPGLVKLAGYSFGILEEEGKGVLQHLIEAGDFTLYGLANAVTRFSQDVESYDRATKLEEIGYSVMTMSPLLLQKINQTQVTKLAA